METKCEITLENLSKEDVKIDNSLGGYCKKVRSRCNLPSPVLTVFTSFEITLFQHNSIEHESQLHNHGQREDYEQEFSKAGDKLKLLPTPSKQPLQQEAKDHATKTVSQLSTVNPHENRRPSTTLPSPFKNIFSL